MKTKILLLAIAIFATGWLRSAAQSVVFPQQQQADVAELTFDGQNTYTLSNALFSATFVKDAEGHLLFGGCPQMNLIGGTPLFQVALGNGTTYTSSDMTLQSVQMKDLGATPTSPKGSDRFFGKELEAVFQKDNLTITWHAVLRDGSHYLRTEMDITASQNQAMQSLTPMIYNVDVETAGTVPVKVGNTRGAVLVSDKIFAGLETPMGLNSATVGETGFDVFSATSWSPEMFCWSPGEDTPDTLLTMKTMWNGTAIPVDKIVGARGYVSVRSTGAQTFTFTYSSGNYRLNILGVDLLDGKGNVVASDYHTGYSGGQKVNNVYTLNIPEKGAYILRYFAETVSEQIDSRGTITFSGKLSTPVVVYDLVAGEQTSASKSFSASSGLTPATSASLSAGSNRLSLSHSPTRVISPVLTSIYDRSGWGIYVDGWNNDAGTGQAAAIIDGNKATYWHSHYSDNTNKAMPHYFIVDMQKVQPVASLGFTTRQAAVGVNGHIKQYQILAGADSANLHLVHNGTLDYSLDEVWVNLDSVVNARFVKVNILSSQNGREFAAVAEFRVAATKSEKQPTKLDEGDTDTDSWTPSYWTQMASGTVPARVIEVGYNYPNVYYHNSDIQLLSAGGTLSTTFLYSSGSNRLQIVGVDLLDEASDVVASDYHFGFTGTARSDNTYSFYVPNEGSYTLRYMMTTGNNEANTSSGNITLTYEVVDTIHTFAPTEVPIEGVWKRPTTLKAGQSWNVSAVVGLVADGQQRRSFLAYSERERAVAWRPMTIYNSWYELNINRNNAKGNEGNRGVKGDYTGNYTSQQCVDVLRQWKTQFYDKYGKAPTAFVWDDGWDEYGTWTFNGNFPQGFAPEDSIAKLMKTGIGAWLGPVGGYGASGNYRRKYWKGYGDMQLSNQDYYNYFVECCNSMIKNYDFRFFKFDGISSQFSSVGPDLTDTGIENAEAIIQIERDVRKARPDIFYNTTVGTWASPFWYHFSDATWRQENDYGTIGVGTDREKWITYRDRLVYQNYVQNSPLCPINTLMTHGLILSRYGSVSGNMDYNGIVREMRCAFGCGSAMVELYVDYERMNNINNGALWKDLSDCMDWQERNKDVLPDIHWVGGNPWDGSAAHIYGWAAWNGRKATITLRNGNTAQQTLSTTLRQILDIPAYIQTTVTLSKSFTDQANLSGLTTGTPVDIDTPLTIIMPASTVYVFEGTDNNARDFDPVPTGLHSATQATEGNTHGGQDAYEAGQDAASNGTSSASSAHRGVYNLHGQRLSSPSHGINIIGGKKVYVPKK